MGAYFCMGVYNRSVVVVVKMGAYIASFPGPTQLFVAISMEKRGEPGIFSHVSMT